jgi:UMF1 family MFS transporter
MVPPPESRPSRRAVLSWAIYDWANSSFATTVMAGFFPIFFKDYWSEGHEPTESTFWLGLSVSTASLIVASVAPFLGAMADRTGRKKRSLAFFAGVGILATGGLFFVGQGNWPAAAALYVAGMIGFLCSLIFYDSLIVSVSDRNTVDMVSSRGYGLGYLGGGLLFLFNVAAVLRPEVFGFSGVEEAVRWAFVSVALWWAVFSIPLLAFVPEPPGGTKMSLARSAREGFTQVIRTFREIRKVKVVFIFLLAYWFYIDGVDTVITMAVDYGKSIGFGTTDLITALLLVQFVGFPFAYLTGFIAQRWGTKRTLLVCLAVYVVVTVVGSNLDLQPYRIFGIELSKFYAVAVLVATVQGGTQALSRAFYSRLIPREKAAEFFGFYNMLGKFATIIGPVLMGTVGRLTGNPRMGIQSVALLFVVGALILWRVDDARPSEATRQ